VWKPGGGECFEIIMNIIPLGQLGFPASTSKNLIFISSPKRVIFFFSISVNGSDSSRDRESIDNSDIEVIIEW